MEDGSFSPEEATDSEEDTDGGTNNKGSTDTESVNSVGGSETGDLNEFGGFETDTSRTSGEDEGYELEGVRFMPRYNLRGAVPVLCRHLHHTPWTA